MSLLRIVASSSAFRLPAAPPPKGSSIDSDWSTKNKKQPGFLRLISAWYAMVFLHFFGITRTTTLPEVTGGSHCLIAPTGRTRRDPDHPVTDSRRGSSGIALGRQRAGLRLPNDRNRFCPGVHDPYRSPQSARHLMGAEHSYLTVHRLGRRPTVS